MKNHKIIITDHAYERGKQRLGLSKKALERTANFAITEGKTEADVHNVVKKYMIKLKAKHGKANNIRLYGNHIFVFVNMTLLTVFLLPKEQQKYLK